METLNVIEFNNGTRYICTHTNTHTNNQSEWVKLQCQIKNVETIKDCDQLEVTIKYMREFGINNVRSEIISDVDLDNDTMDFVLGMLHDENNICNKCLKGGQVTINCCDLKEDKKFEIEEHELSMEYCLNAAKNGSESAKSALETFYLNLAKIAIDENDPEKAIEYYKLAITNGNGNKKTKKELNLYYGKLVEIAEEAQKLKKHDDVIKYFSIAINNKYNIAMRKLGMYYLGEKDYDNAVKYLKMAIDEENNVAMNNLGEYYHNIVQDYELALKYFLMASNYGNKDAINNLGYYYCNIVKDYDKAEKYYKFAIEKGSIDALLNLGYYYCNIAKDYKQGTKYLNMYTKEKRG
jgi:TPR repeat protein